MNTGDSEACQKNLQLQGSGVKQLRNETKKLATHSTAFSVSRIYQFESHLFSRSESCLQSLFIRELSSLLKIHIAFVKFYLNISAFSIS
jgi:hypothetical protein